MNILSLIEIILQVIIMILLTVLYKKEKYKTIFIVSLLLSATIIVENLKYFIR